MRVIGGIASGIEIRVPHGNSVRPSSASSKKALFDSIGDFRNKIIADIFAGSGALGLEAASRGASELIFLEKLPKNCAVIEENCSKIRDAGAVFSHKIICADILRFFAWNPPALDSPDIIFSDPPYADSVSLMSKLLRIANFAKWAKKSLLIWETPNFRLDLTECLDGSEWEIVKVKKFGGKNFVFIKVF